MNNFNFFFQVCQPELAHSDISQMLDQAETTDTQKTGELSTGNQNMKNRQWTEPL